LLLIPDIVVCHAGLVMMQAASIASVLQEEELICPFIVITKGSNQQSIEFEAGTQDQAIAEGWDSLEKYKDKLDLWAFAREGLRKGLSKGPQVKSDVLVVAAWTHGMVEPVVFTQEFLPRAKGGFALLGPIVLQDTVETVGFAAAFTKGIDKHPKGHLWNSWHAS
jgi:hypothetical protein